MKGPSLDAIRKFKSVQELKKKEEEDKKIKDKLAILEHRALQGDRKAKTDLKKIKDALEKPPPETKTNQGPSHLPSIKRSSNVHERPSAKANHGVKKQKPPTDFDELMRIAKQNATQGPKPNASKQTPVLQPPIPVSKKAIVRKETQSSPTRLPPASKPLLSLPKKADLVRKEPTLMPASRNMMASRNRELTIAQTQANYVKQPRKVFEGRFVPVSQVPRGPQTSHTPRFRQVTRHDQYYDDDDEDEDDYESDGFVVDEEDDGIQDEVRNTIRSVFNYDKRRCDLRERELDREYRAIGRVSTFEDLEREERRASRLAAVEDAKELRMEEERKRLKLAKKAGKGR